MLRAIPAFIDFIHDNVMTNPIKLMFSLKRTDNFSFSVELEICSFALLLFFFKGHDQVPML